MDDVRQTDLEDFLSLTVPVRSFTATAGEFTKAVAAASRVLDRTTIPILTHVLLSWDLDSATVVGTDMEIATSVQFACSGGAGACVLSGTTLLDALKRLPPAETVTLIQAQPDDDVALSCGRFRATLRTKPEAEYPAMDSGAFSHSFALPGDDLRRLIDHTRMAVSTNETHHSLCGVHLHVAGDRLFAVATNKAMLARDDAPLPEGASDMPGIIIPTKSVAEIRRIIDGADEVRIDLTAFRFRVTAGGASLVTKLIDGTFPDYAPIIPEDAGDALKVGKSELVRAVDAVAGFAEGVTGFAGAKGGLIVMDLVEEGCIVRASETTKGAARDEIDGAVWTGNWMHIGLMGRDVLAVCGGLDDDVEVAIRSDTQPLVVTNAGSRSPLYLLTPFKI